jgi:hypothetical protein
LHGRAVLAEQLRDFSAGLPRRHQQQSMQSVIVARLLATSDLLLNRYSHHLSILDLQLAHRLSPREKNGAIISRCCIIYVVVFKCVVLKLVGGVCACFPKIPPSGNATWDARQGNANRRAGIWEKMEWFSPFWIPHGRISELLAVVERSPKEQAIEVFNYHTSTLYTLAFQAVCIEQFMAKSRSLAEFVPLAREAYLAFYSGYRAASVAALIPAIEGALTRIVEGGDELKPGEKIDRAIDKAIALAAEQHFKKMWVPREYLTTEFLFPQDERVFAFETFRRWLHRSFFRPTGEYDGQTWLNRHVFAHGMSSSWQQSTNFIRLVVALATLGLVESWHDDSHQISIFMPEMSDDSTLLWQRALFQAQSQLALNKLAEQNYHKHGRLVPEMPTDDGSLQRKALLSDDCMKDLVRPLRDAGWGVEVSEPDDKGLYMTVVAKSGEEQFGITLLYSCATENALYKRLAESSKAILYRGPPYQQEQFARGVSVHVGPVAGWQPPRASMKTTQ